MYLFFHPYFYILAKNVVLAGVKVLESICTKPFSLQHISWREIVVVGPEGLILKEGSSQCSVERIFSGYSHFIPQEKLVEWVR